ncbi:MAG: translation elongation factor Ts [Elusimicrobia bacterium RIFCSPLOWO2_02_FULL_39_32]|nr:MAG: translation elongation factor Ts [Elusimicrobia bacterium RIFCSPHIGHO2_02_FULL_39_36]OGR91416.1 MAG: translation elongation factor Ts [Elusimicrobia bacterium RIFCSPLOWO2_02_FULL_39_32]OGR98531.1 MAG: translation elongation factor Ts [Elusimicrobia bacterium RIFCSPLOWO2_12_FULL_39_28]
MSVSAQAVQKLREITSAGILDCKKALESSSGDQDKAIQFLREKGKASAAKKAERSAKEGVVCVWITSEGKNGGMVELNCETDFVARTKEFQDLAKNLAQQVAEEKISSSEDLKSKNLKGSEEAIISVLKEKIGKLGENIVIKKAISLGGDGIVVGSYVHAPYDSSQECGRLGVLMELTSNLKDANEFSKIAKELSMQVAATNPRWVKKEDVPAECVQKEKEIYRQQCKESGKPEAAWEKIIDGKLKDFYKQFCLLEQNHVRDSSGKTSVQSFINNTAQNLGAAISIQKFARFKLGEE